MSVKERLYRLLREKQIFNKKLLVLMLAFLAVGAFLFLTAKKLDEHGVCLAKGRVFTDEELYQNAMHDFVKNELNESDASRGSRPGMDVGEQRGPVHCGERACDVWIAPPATYEQIREQFRQLGSYAPIKLEDDALDYIAKKFGWQVIKEVNQAGGGKQSSNSSIVLITRYKVPQLYPSNCCKIANLQTLQREYSDYKYMAIVRNKNMDDINKIETKYLLTKSVYVGDFDTYQDVGRGLKKFPLEYHENVYEINACGKIKRD